MGMNKQGLKKSDGGYVRLQPPARGPQDEVLDDDWRVQVGDTTLELENVRNGSVVRMTFDHVHNYCGDADRSTPDHA